jgi:hypothetical protein
MDILNWIYLKRQQLIKKLVNKPDTDLIVLGAEVPFTKRDDGYQTYAMTVADFAEEVRCGNDTLYTGIFDNYPFPIGYPVILKTCTKVIDTPAFPTFLAVNLQGWKVTGSVQLVDNSFQGVIYLGTVENTGNAIENFPWKINGTVFTFDQAGGIEIQNTLANGALMHDVNNSINQPVNIIFVPVYFSGGFDLFLAYDTVDLTAELQGVISFEYEFLQDLDIEPTFTYYP